MEPRNLQEAIAAIVLLQAQVSNLESQHANSGSGTPPPANQATNPADGLDKFSPSFYWDTPGRWLDVVIPVGETAVRKGAPPPGWSGQLIIEAGRQPPDNLTDRIMVTVNDGENDIYRNDSWVNLDGFSPRITASDKPFTVAVKSEKFGHISLQCGHTP